MREDKQTMPRNHRQPTTNPTKQQPTQPISKQTASHQPIKPTALQTLALPKQKSLAPDRLAGTRKKPEAKCIMLWEACHLPHRVNPDAIITVCLTENASKQHEKNVRKKRMAKHEKCRKKYYKQHDKCPQKNTNNNEKVRKTRQTTQKMSPTKQHEQPRKKNVARVGQTNVDRITKKPRN
jgi:hypothetical protein